MELICPAGTPTDDKPEEDGKAAEDLDEMVLGRRKESPSSRFHFDLDLPPEMVDLKEIASELTYPEWDYRKATYLKNHCRSSPSRRRQAAITWKHRKTRRRW
ncbi:nitric oxide reductase activation protein [Neorhizobium galegae]|nr:nitric oxide reductase activation protein [Neorhizobium galegae]